MESGLRDEPACGFDMNLTGIREFLSSRGGYAVCAALALIALASIWWSFRSNLGPSLAARSSNAGVMVCSTTLKSFDVKLEAGMTIPVPSPHSGERTGYPADAVCTWTKDGTVSSRPSYVLMNETRGLKGPTFCPDCNRQVVRDNPQAAADRKPPPTQAEYTAARGSSTVRSAGD